MMDLPVGNKQRRIWYRENKFVSKNLRLRVSFIRMMHISKQISIRNIIVDVRCCNIFDIHRVNLYN